MDDKKLMAEMPDRIKPERSLELQAIRLATQSDMQELAMHIVEFAQEKQMTLNNIRDAVGIVEEYMIRNAVLDRTQETFLAS